MDQYKNTVFAIQIGIPDILYGKIKGIRVNVRFTVIEYRISELDLEHMEVIFGNIPGVIIFPNYNFVYVSHVFPITMWLHMQVAWAYVSRLCQTSLWWPFVLQVSDVVQLCSCSDLSS